MRKVFSFASKTLDNFRAFPEFSQMDSSLNEAGVSAIKYSHDWNESCGHIYTEFVKRQPPAISEQLAEIQKLGNERFSVLQTNNETYRNLKSNLQPIQPINAAMREKRKNLKDLNQNVQKMAKAHQNAEIKSQRANVKNPSSPDAMKAKTELDVALQKKEASEKQYEQFNEQFQKDNKTYKKEIFTTLLNLLIDFSTKLGETCDTQLPIVNEIAKQGTLILNADCTDPDCPKLQEELDALREAEKEKGKGKEKETK